MDFAGVLWPGSVKGDLKPTGMMGHLIDCSLRDKIELPNTSYRLDGELLSAGRETTELEEDLDFVFFPLMLCFLPSPPVLLYICPSVFHLLPILLASCTPAKCHLVPLNQSLSL